jgi:hypothetical protein
MPRVVRKDCNMNANNSKMKSRSLRLAGAMLTCGALLCCGCGSGSGRASLRIYQAPTLRLERGTEVRTTDGIYQAQADEVWYSAALYTERAREADALAAALQQARSGNK